jgi:hypothetical protein
MLQPSVYMGDQVTSLGSYALASIFRFACKLIADSNSSSMMA